MSIAKIVFISIGTLAVVLTVLVQLFRRRKHRREMERQAEDRLREEALDHVLVGKESNAKDLGTAVPFDVKYDADQRKKGEQNSRRATAQAPVMLQLTEHSELSTRKYMFHVSDHITFGRVTQNDIVINWPRLSERQCEIFRIQKELYLKNLGTEGLVFLKRKKRRIMVDAEAVGLENKDQIQIGGYSYDILIL